ncbi:MAG: alpha/beta fold hydrolase [Candidatus Thorarchaeota archaeon]
MAYLLSQPVRRPVAVALVDTSPDLDLSKIAPGLVIEAVESYFFLIKKRMTDKESLAYKIWKEEEDRKREHPETVRRDLRACDRFDITARVGDIDLPVFVIHGDDDDIIPLGVAEELVRRLPRADIAIVRGSDHCPMVQQPEEFNRLLGKFLDWVDRKFGAH